jgi:outer membrane lipoprotein-sorting protein
MRFAMSLNKWLLPGLLVFLVNFAVLAQKDRQAETILNNVSERYQSLSGLTASFEYTYSTSPGDVAEKSTGQVAVKGDKYKLVLNDQEIYNNGKTVWTYIKSNNFKEVTINTVEDNADELTPSNIYNIYKKGYSYKLLGEKPQNGITVQEIELVAEKRNSQFQRIKLFVDKSSMDLIGWEIQDEMGGVFSYRFREIDTQANLPDSHFVFDTQKHPDVEVIDLR